MNSDNHASPLPTSSAWAPLSKTRARLIASLSQTKRRRKEGLFTAEGHKSVADLLRPGSAYSLYCLVATPDYLERHAASLPAALSPAQCALATEAQMREISALATPSDVMAVMHMPEDPNQCDALAEPLSPALYLLLDGVQDPGNLGTIIRTCHWFGIDRIFASRDTVDIYNPKTVQSTMGSLGAVRVEYVDLPALADRNQHLPLVGLQLEGNNLFTTPLPQSAMICMGSEGNGLSPEMQHRLTLSLTIPPASAADHPESLNVAIATAITVAQFKH